MLSIIVLASNKTDLMWLKLARLISIHYFPPDPFHNENKYRNH